MTVSRALAVAAALVLCLAAGAFAATGPTAISGRTPFPQGCGVSGAQTPDSEAEPYLAVNPADPSNAIAVYQQDRFPVDGGALSNLAAVTHDGGEHFTTVRFPGLSRCTGGSEERASDPWISFGGDGTAYAANLTFNENPLLGAAGLAGPTALSSSTSRDGGLHWDAPVTIVNQSLYDDREALTADPGRPGHAYVTWVRRLGAFGENGSESFSRTVDAGKTWTSPKQIYTPGPVKLPDPILLDVLPDGTLLNVFLVIDARSQIQSDPLPFDILAMHSTDEGQTWSAPVRIAQTPSTSPADPDSGSEIRSLPIVSLAIGPTGRAFVVWNEIASPTSSTIHVADSADRGASWSPPRTVARSGGQAFLPSIAAGRDGSLGVLYDDTRNDRRADKALTTDVWLDTSRDGGTTRDERHVAGPFDALTASETSSTGVAGHFIGDYQGFAAMPGGFGAAFAQAKPAATAGPSDIFFARLPLQAGVAAVRPSATLHVRVSPRRVLIGRATRLTITVRRGSVPARSVRVRVAGRTLRTDVRGAVHVVLRARHAGRVRIHASRRGLRSDSTYVRLIASG